MSIFFFLITLSLGSTRLCGTAADSPIANMTTVKITGNPAVNFEMKKPPHVEQVNGRINIAFTSTENVLFQVTGLLPPGKSEAEKRKIYSPGEFRLILMNITGLDGALVSPEETAEAAEVVMEQFEVDQNSKWKIHGRGPVQAGDRSYEVQFTAVLEEIPVSKAIRNSTRNAGN